MVLMVGLVRKEKNMEELKYIQFYDKNEDEDVIIPLTSVDYFISGKGGHSEGKGIRCVTKTGKQFLMDGIENIPEFNNLKAHLIGNYDLMKYIEEHQLIKPRRKRN